MDFESDVKMLNNVKRSTYVDIYRLISDNMWDNGGTIQVRDIKSILNSSEEEISSDDFKIGNPFISFVKADSKIANIVRHNTTNYSSEESEKFINEVKASNITDISDSGYFYKKLGIALDNTKCIVDDCGSKGEIVKIKRNNGEIDKDFYEFYLKDMNFEIGDEFFNTRDYDSFKEICGDKEEITLFSPITCELNKKHCYCKKCVGRINSGGRELPYKNIGLLTVLAVTEQATQASLDSMNKGSSESVTKILEKKMDVAIGAPFEDYIKEIRNIISYIGWVGVQARWFEISLISKIFKREDGGYIQTPFQNTPKHFEDKLANFIFSPTISNFQRILDDKEIPLTSEKSKMLFDIY